MTIKIGDTFPDISVKVLTNGVWDIVTTKELLSGHRTVLFAFPGAFTPTCSNQHLPGFLAHVDAFKKKGITQVVGLTVNDPFVLEHWAKFCNIGDKIKMIADGSSILTGRLEMELDMIDYHFGIRTKRYGMVLNGQVVEHLVLEPDVIKCDLSSAEHLLSIL